MPFGSESKNSTHTAVHVLPSKYYDKFLSVAAKSWKPSPVWDLLRLERKPGMISMLAGKPNPVTFPFTSLSVNILSPDGGDDTKITLTDSELHAALQYGVTRGMPALVEFLTNLMKHLHGRGDDEGWRLSIGPGTQDYLFKALTTLLDAGNSVLVENPTYPGATPVFANLNVNTFDVVADADGIIPAALEKLLDNWPADKQRPKLLYTVPNGSNPSGYTTSQERRVKILQLARKHDFLILEDDPFFHLYFGARPRPASYLSLEKSLGGQVGRVVRLDSFSKVLTSGFRFGWVTGPTVVVDAIDCFSMLNSVQCSSLTQILVYKVLSTWGLSGYMKHTARVASFYRSRQDIFEMCVRRHLTGLADWTPPDAGMFYWIKLRLPPTSGGLVIQQQTTEEGTEGDSGEHDEGDATLLVMKKAVEKNLLVLPGSYSYFDNRPSPYIRVAYSMISDADMDEGLRRLSSAIREEWDAWRSQVRHG